MDKRARFLQTPADRKRSATSSWQITDQMWQKFMLLSLTPIILHAGC